MTMPSLLARATRPAFYFCLSESIRELNAGFFELVRPTIPIMLIEGIR
jgi:hypothetical protein